MWQLGRGRVRADKRGTGVIPSEASEHREEGEVALIRTELAVNGVDCGAGRDKGLESPCNRMHEFFYSGFFGWRGIVAQFSEKAVELMV